MRVKLGFVFVLKELAAMIDKHRNENEKWLADWKKELKEERKQLEQEKVLHILWVWARWLLGSG